MSQGRQAVVSRAEIARLELLLAGDPTFEPKNAVERTLFADMVKLGALEEKGEGEGKKKVKLTEKEKKEKTGLLEKV
jgi:hypothetical protein